MRDAALRRFRAKTGVDAYTDRAVAFAVTAAIRAQQLHSESAHFNHVANKGQGVTSPQRALSEAQVTGWKFGHLYTKVVNDALGGKALKSGAKSALSDVFTPLVQGGVLFPPRKGSPGDVGLRRLVVLVVYLWRHQGRPPLQAMAFRDLAVGMGLDHHVADESSAWRRRVREAHKVLGGFDPNKPVPESFAPDLVNLYAAASGIVFDARRNESFRWRPDHRELVSHIIATQPLMDIVSFARGRPSLIALPP